VAQVRSPHLRPRCPDLDAAGALLLLATRSGPHDVRPATPRPRRRADRRRAWSDRRSSYFLAAILPVQIVFFQHEAAMRLPGARSGTGRIGLWMMFTINT